MAVKIVRVADLGTVRLQKRRGTSNLRISVDQKGNIRVGMPSWLPFQSGIDFARSHAGWIEKQRSRQPVVSLLKNGDRIGKNHTLRITYAGDDIKTRITATDVIVTLPDIDIANSDVQAKILAACERALKKEAQILLPQRLAALARQNNYIYNSLHIKKLKTRWGSCSSQQDITLNYFLMQLPWELIDYVLLHELNHTQHMHHQRDFWDALENVLPDCKTRRKALKEFQPTVIRTTL